MSGPIPVNPAVLRWARESLGMTVEDVATRLQRDAAVIDAWERGEDAPTYVQLETVAYKIYKRPIAIFFFPEPPDEESVERSFRTLPQDVIESIPPRIRYLLRKAKVLQLNLIELYEGVNPAPRFILRDLTFTPNVSATAMAARVRAYLGIDLEQQQAWGDEDEAFKQWRNALEECGVFVFKDSFNAPGKKRPGQEDSLYSGFCLYDEDFPVIYVNNNNARTRQVFTLFHELAHLFMHTGGVDTRRDDYIELLTGADRRIEVLCNRFAAEFLAPSDDFWPRAERMQIDDESISRLAKRYHVSREVILRRLLDRQRVTQEYYEQKTAQWDSERKRRGSGGDYYLTRGAYLGERYVDRVLSSYYQNRITMEEAAEYLGEKTKNLAGVEAWLFRQGSRQ